MLVFPHAELYIITFFLSSLASALGILLASGAHTGAAGPLAVGSIGMVLVAIFAAAIVWVLVQLARIHGVLGIKYVPRLRAKPAPRKQDAGRTPKASSSAAPSARPSATGMEQGGERARPGPVAEAKVGSPSGSPVQAGRRGSKSPARPGKPRAASDGVTMLLDRPKQGDAASKPKHDSVDDGIGVQQDGVQDIASTHAESQPPTAQAARQYVDDLPKQLRQLKALRTAPKPAAGAKPAAASSSSAGAPEPVRAVSRQGMLSSEHGTGGSAGGRDGQRKEEKPEGRGPDGEEEGGGSEEETRGWWSRMYERRMRRGDWNRPAQPQLVQQQLEPARSEALLHKGEQAGALPPPPIAPKGLQSAGLFPPFARTHPVHPATCTRVLHAGYIAPPAGGCGCAGFSIVWAVRALLPERAIEQAAEASTAVAEAPSAPRSAWASFQGARPLHSREDACCGSRAELAP